MAEPETLLSILKAKEKEIKTLSSKLKKVENKYIELVRTNRALNNDKYFISVFLNCLGFLHYPSREPSTTPQNDSTTLSSAAEDFPPPLGSQWYKTYDLKATLERLLLFIHNTRSNNSTLCAFLQMMFPYDEFITEYLDSHTPATPFASEFLASNDEDFRLPSPPSEKFKSSSKNLNAANWDIPSSASSRSLRKEKQASSSSNAGLASSPVSVTSVSTSTTTTPATSLVNGTEDATGGGSSVRGNGSASTSIGVNVVENMNIDWSGVGGGLLEGIGNMIGYIGDSIESGAHLVGSGNVSNSESSVGNVLEFEVLRDKWIGYEESVNQGLVTVQKSSNDLLRQKEDECLTLKNSIRENEETIKEMKDEINKINKEKALLLVTQMSSGNTSGNIGYAKLAGINSRLPVSERILEDVDSNIFSLTKTAGAVGSDRHSSGSAALDEFLAAPSIMLSKNAPANLPNTLPSSETNLDKLTSSTKDAEVGTSNELTTVDAPTNTDPISITKSDSNSLSATSTSSPEARARFLKAIHETSPSPKQSNDRDSISTKRKLSGSTDIPSAKDAFGVTISREDTESFSYRETASFDCASTKVKRNVSSGFHGSGYVLEASISEKSQLSDTESDTVKASCEKSNFGLRIEEESRHICDSSIKAFKGENKRLREERDRLKVETKTAKSQAREMLRAKDQAMEKFKERMRLLEQETSSDTVLNEMAQRQAARDSDIQNLRSDVAVLQITVKESEHLLELERQQSNVLKTQIRELESSKGRQGENLDYLKHVVVRYVEYTKKGDKAAEALLPVISTILHLDRNEEERITQDKRGSLSTPMKHSQSIDIASETLISDYAGLV